MLRVRSQAPAVAAAGTVLEKLAAFPATSLATDLTPVEPPDTQVAAGPTYVAEAVNDTLSIWSRGGGFVRSYDLNTSFLVPAGFFVTDPRLVYDALSGRWFLSVFDFDSSNDSHTYVAVSDSADPTAGWSFYVITSYIGTVTDQPKIGVSSDKVVISWNDYSPSFSGQETQVLQKSDLLAARAVAFWAFPADVSRFNLVPVISLSAMSTEYVVYNDTCSAAGGVGTGSCTTGSPSLGVIAITGTPAANDVTWNETNPALPQTSNPPPATQPNGPAINTNDDRLLSAVWQNNALWATANDRCVPGGVPQSCMLLVHATTAGTPAIVSAGLFGASGYDEYFPAVSLDQQGDAYVVGTLSSASTYPSVVAFGGPPTSAPFAGIYLWIGTGPYTGSRWGDYSGAAIDPSDPDDVWVAGEYGTSTGANWGTAIGEVTLNGPSVTNVSPAIGLTTGGTKVTVHGTNFGADTTVSFGATPASNVTVSSATQLVATSPAHAAGSVAVTVTTADGTSPASNADTYTYVSNPIAAHLTFNCDIRSQANAKYVSAELGYTSYMYAALRARSTSVGAWEKYQCAAIGANRWAIRSRANGKYVSAELSYAGSLQGTLRARASTVGSWEQFTIVPTGARFALNSSANSKYVSSELNYAGSLYSLLRARAGTIGSWETYSITIDST
jgi:hypothetical protein